MENRKKYSNVKVEKKNRKPINIVYAGNIGVGQGLELIVIPVAKHFNNHVKFQLIGDGSSVKLIQKCIVKNRKVE